MKAMVMLSSGSLHQNCARKPTPLGVGGMRPPRVRVEK